jgi:hypothetical protein
VRACRDWENCNTSRLIARITAFGWNRSWRIARMSRVFFLLLFWNKADTDLVPCFKGRQNTPPAISRVFLWRELERVWGLAMALHEGLQLVCTDWEHRTARTLIVTSSASKFREVSSPNWCRAARLYPVTCYLSVLINRPSSEHTAGRPRNLLRNFRESSHWRRNRRLQTVTLWAEFIHRKAE